MAVRHGVFQDLAVGDLTIGDERAFRHVPLYAPLKEVLRRDRYVFRALPPSSSQWQNALLLNLTFWAGKGDVLQSDRVTADVVTHAAWHHLASAALRTKRGSAPSPEVLFFGESIASAFDAYLVGVLLAAAPRASFLATQVPAMAEAARSAGLSAVGFRTMLEGMAQDPGGSFASLRELLYDAACGLLMAAGTEQALGVLVRSRAHRFGPLLHHYELSNWVLYARAYAKRRRRPDPLVAQLDRNLRTAPSALDWLRDHWIEPRFTRGRQAAAPAT